MSDLSEEEKKTIEDSKELIEELEKRKDKDFIGRLYYKSKPVEDTLRLLLNIVDKQQKEIEEKSTIIMVGAEKVKQLEEKIILLKIEKLRAMKQYKECHLSQIPDTANIYYSMKLELEAIDEEISYLMRIWKNY